MYVLHIAIYTYIYVFIAMYKPHGNHKPKIHNRYTQTKRKRNPNVTLEIAIKSQKKGKTTTTTIPQNNPKTINKMAVRTYILIIILNVMRITFKCKWNKCSNQKT